MYRCLSSASGVMTPTFFWVKGRIQRGLGASFLRVASPLFGRSPSATLPRFAALPHGWEAGYGATHRSSALPCIPHLGLQQRNVFFARLTEKLVLPGLSDAWKGHGPRI